MYNRQTGSDNIYGDGIQRGYCILYNVQCIGAIVATLSKSISEDFAKWRQQRFQRDARDRENRSSAKILRV